MKNILPTCRIVLILSMEKNPTFNTQPGRVVASDIQPANRKNIKQQILEETHDLSNLEQIPFRSFSLELGQGGLRADQKSMMSKLYRVGLKLEKSISHIGFLKDCLDCNLVPKGLSFQANKFDKEVEEALAKAEKIRLEIEISKHINEKKVYAKTIDDVFKNTHEIFTEGEEKVLKEKFFKSKNNWKKMLTRRKNKKFKDLENEQKVKNIPTSNFEVEQFFGEFWNGIVSKKGRRRKLSRKKRIIRKKKKDRQRRQQTQMTDQSIEEDIEGETWARDFFDQAAKELG